MNPKVFVVMPVHNGIEHTLPTVRTLLPLLPPQGRIVVVDDGSTDGTSEKLHREFPEVTVLQGDGNLWWSGAINLGVRHALERGMDYVLFLNNDIVLHPQFLEELLLGAREFPGSLVASMIQSADEPGIIWSMGGKLDWKWGMLWMSGYGQKDNGGWNEPVEADWLPGMSVLVPSSVFSAGIRVDEKTFPQYYGDSDFSIRARRAGFRLIVWPKSRVYNKVRSTGLDTRLVKGLESFTLKAFWASLTSIRSSRCVPIYVRWLLRHAPVWSWPMMAGRFYGYYFLKCLHIWLKLRVLPKKQIKVKSCRDAVLFEEYEHSS